MSGWTEIHLDQLEAIPWEGSGPTWRPLRSALGARIVGMGTFTAEQAGEELIEPHREAEDGMGHEEIYVVLRGRATFTLDRSELDAPAATFVRVAAQVHRRAVATEGNTAVLALGGMPTFEPSSSEWIERARPHIRSDPERARAIVDELRAERPGSPGIPIAEALLAAGRGDRAAAARLLGEVEPRYRDALRADPDLRPLLG